MVKETKKNQAGATGKELVTSKNALQTLAMRLQVSPDELKRVLKASLGRVKGQDGKYRELTDEEFMAMVIVSNTYHLNPILKEICPFVSKSGAVVPVVPIDGWVSLVKNQRDFDGVELIENEADPSENLPGDLKSVTAVFYLKDKSHPVKITEYMKECYNENKDTWRKWPRRMLRHKAYIQGARIAEGLSGIYDQDEAERISEAQVVDQTSEKPQVTAPQEKLPAPNEKTKNDGKKSDIISSMTGESKVYGIKEIVYSEDLDISSSSGKFADIKGILKGIEKEEQKKKGKKQILHIYLLKDEKTMDLLLIKCWESLPEENIGKLVIAKKVQVYEVKGEPVYVAEAMIGEPK